jgi:hypothetical protein
MSKLRGLVSALAAALLLHVSTASSAEVVTDWLATVPKALTGSPPGQVGRAAVLVDLAMFDALNAITPRYTSYGPAVETVPDASHDAAAATASWVALSSVPGVDQAALLKALEEPLKPVTDAAAKSKGSALGMGLAHALLASRADDAFARVEPA